MEMIPIVDGLEDDFKGQASVLQLDAAQGDNAKLQAELGLIGHPSFAVLDIENRITKRFFGPQTNQILR